MAADGFDRGQFVGYFRDEARELLERIDGDLLALEAGGDAAAIDSIFRSLHTIKGSAGMLDFGQVHTLVHGLESAVDLVRSGRRPLDDVTVELIFSGRDLLGETVEAAITGAATPPGYAAMLERVQGFVRSAAEEPAPSSASAPAAPTADVVDEAALFEAEVARLLAEQTAPATPPATPAPAIGVTPQPSISPAPAKPAPSARAEGGTIRVALERLDLLLDLVGELVINRTRIASIAASLQRLPAGDGAQAIKDLAVAASALGRITAELQETVMKARMVPVGGVFERFPRAVRDLAKTTGKEIALSISGAQTDLDKTIVDQIGEPLMHLVRNCVDHGIETPAARLAAGKPATGTVRLHAYHEGNQVVIEVGDDGDGISLERVHRRGVERGLIDPATHYTDDEIIDLIFAPGFSTAATVTGLSGRGVGMDVVKKSVQDLGGQLEVRSESGRGSAFFIRLPLTLAIIRTLLVRVGPRLFAIPLDVVIESQRIAEAQIRTIGGARVATVRGAVLPLIDLARVFGVAGAGAGDGYVMIVTVAHKGKHVGLIVDSFDGDQEIVIKPLSDLLGEPEHLSGAAILGNGAIALILDVASLAQAGARTDHPAPVSARATAEV